MPEKRLDGIEHTVGAASVSGSEIDAPEFGHMWTPKTSPHRIDRYEIMGPASLYL